jgi:hypothetical protein
MYSSFDVQHVDHSERKSYVFFGSAYGRMCCLEPVQQDSYTTRFFTLHSANRKTETNAKAIPLMIMGWGITA